MWISDFIDKSNQLDSPEEIVTLMERVAGDLGFDKYAYCALTRHDDYDTGDNPEPLVAHNFPASWIDYYFKHDYSNKDPVVLHAPEVEGPFLWDWVGKVFKLDRAQSTVMHQADEAKLKNGVAVPLHGPRGNVCLMTFATGDGHPDPAAEMQKLHILAAQFHAAYSEVSHSKYMPVVTASLSGRERECLHWIARGKTSWDIGMILGISENTVNFHIKNAFKKLETNSRISAVVKAVRHGLIAV